MVNTKVIEEQINMLKNDTRIVQPYKGIIEEYINNILAALHSPSGVCSTDDDEDEIESDTERFNLPSNSLDNVKTMMGYGDDASTDD